MQSHPFWTYLNTSFLIKYLLLFACGWAAIEVLEYFKIVVFVFICSTILAFLLSHPMRWLKRFLPHNMAAFTVFIVALTVIGSLAITVSLAVIAQGQPLIDNLADLLTSLTPRIEQMEKSLQLWDVPVDLQAIVAQLKDQVLGLLGASVGLLQALLRNFLLAILIAVVTFFMLLDGDRLWHWLIKFVPIDQRDRVSQTVQKNLLGFFGGRLLLSFLVATSTFIVFLIFQVPYALTLAVVIGLFDLIPGVGTTLGIGLVILFLLSQSVVLAIKSAIICIVIEQLGENLLLPRIMRDSLNINPVVMFFALIVGARIAGVLGIFLSIPVASTIVSLLEIDEMKGQAAVTNSPAPTSEDNSQ
jgi:predicted PurR-regulated permease PerM